MKRLTVIYLLLMLGLLGSSLVLYGTSSNRRAKLQAYHARLEAMQLNMDELGEQIKQVSRENPGQEEIVALRSEFDRLTYDLEAERARYLTGTVDQEWISIVASFGVIGFSLSVLIASLKIASNSRQRS